MEWIKCSERLPRKYLTVLIFAPNFPHKIMVRKRNIEYWLSESHEDGSGIPAIELEEITHWMPLPESPNEAL